MASFHEVRFPEGVAYGMSGGPTYKTTVLTTASGKEQRVSSWSAGRMRWSAAHGIKNESEATELIEFFRARRGQLYGFRFKDWVDYKLVAEPIGTGDGLNRVFTVVKTYASTGPGTEVRRIYKLRGGPGDPNTIVSEAVHVGAVLQSPADYVIDYNTGTITFDVGKEPGDGLEVTYTGEFDVPVRFDGDDMNMNYDEFNAYSWSGINLIELNPLQET